MVKQETFNFDFEPIKGYPELRWAAKRPFTGTSYYPAQLKESYGSPSDDGWMNKLYWGDNLQVMSHLLKEYRGKVNLIYIDPPFDSKADYKKTISLRGKKTESDSSNFEEKQYGDIWTNDEYLQFMYERLVLCKELLSENGSIYVHMDEKRVHYLKIIMDEVFSGYFKRDIIWRIGWISGYKSAAKQWIRNHDNILYYVKGHNPTFNKEYIPYPEGYTRRDGAKPEGAGYPIEDTWNCSELDSMNSIQIMSFSSEKVGYPTQKNESLLERIIKASSNPGDIVFDCFMGSGTTQAVAMKLGRRFLGADINLGAIQTTTKRLINRAKELESQKSETSLFGNEASPGSASTLFTGFEVYNVNDYDFFRNELEAKRLIIDALGMQALPENNLWDAELDGRMVSILGINRIATASEFEKIIANIDISSWQKKQLEDPNSPVEKITFVCMGHDPNLKAMFEQKMESLGFKVDLQIVDILRDKKDLRFKRDADAKIIIKKNLLKVSQFYPMNLLQKLSIEKKDISDWKELADSIMIDWHYDGVTFSPEETDVPEKNQLVKGEYKIPQDAGTIHIKITDLISESWEGTYSADGEKL
ncbi:MAG: site-specific DNA-methyltransferase [Treponema sp.]|nr:site-specific DNA-methyltransferase [Candidatus Treponema scatequi]